MLKVLIFILALQVQLRLVAQDENWLSFPTDREKTMTGGVTYKEDPRSKKLIDFMSFPQPPEYTVQIDGFRVQIFFSNDRELINKQRENFVKNNRDIETYIEYDAPNYSIKVGNFRTELEAEQLRQSISSEFPSSIIQKSKIELPKIQSTPKESTIE